MIEAVVARSIAEFDGEAWDRCFPDRLEGWHYLLATERAGLAGFDWQYLALRQHGRLLAAVPAFATAYRLDTTVQGMVKRLTERIERWRPGLLSLPLLCLGSPTTERCTVGFAPEAPAADRAQLLALLLAEAEGLAARMGIGLIAAKDVPDAHAELWRLGGADFQRMIGLPTAVLDLADGNDEAYLARLSKATRKDVRRKLRAATGVRTEVRRHINDVLPRLMELYHATRARSDLQFEELTADYFTGVLAELGDRARCVLYWQDERLIGFNLVLRDGARMIDKFFGMDPALGRAHNLYVVSWMTNVRLCLEWSLPLYQSGQAGYAIKRRLGCRLDGNWNYFRHRRPWAHAALGWIAKIVSPDRYDPTMTIEDDR